MVISKILLACYRTNVRFGGLGPVWLCPRKPVMSIAGLNARVGLRTSKGSEWKLRENDYVICSSIGDSGPQRPTARNNNREPPSQLQCDAYNPTAPLGAAALAHNRRVCCLNLAILQPPRPAAPPDHLPPPHPHGPSSASRALLQIRSQQLLLGASVLRTGSRSSHPRIYLVSCGHHQLLESWCPSNLHCGARPACRPPPRRPSRPVPHPAAHAHDRVAIGTAGLGYPDVD